MYDFFMYIFYFQAVCGEAVEDQGDQKDPSRLAQDNSRNSPPCQDSAWASPGGGGGGQPHRVLQPVPSSPRDHINSEKVKGEGVNTPPPHLRNLGIFFATFIWIDNRYTSIGQTQWINSYKLSARPWACSGSEFPEPEVIIYRFP